LLSTIFIFWLVLLIALLSVLVPVQAITNSMSQKRCQMTIVLMFTTCKSCRGAFTQCPECLVFITVDINALENQHYW